jgi:translation initiation factor 2B subunit (eIF-2B alpha/beta/delta family)/ADP-ribose pyrophosphatase YjhB (NUDIX family)
VGTYQGKWAGVSGFLEEGEDPLQRARIEIEEEVALKPAQAIIVRSGDSLRALDEEKDTVWIVHPFLFDVLDQKVRLDWENSESKWIDPDELSSFDTVPRLKEVFERVRWDLEGARSILPNALRAVDELSLDRVHGASSLGQRSIEVLAEVGRGSNASSVNELFSHLLSMTLELRRRQPSMATIRNQTGRFMFEIDAARKAAESVGVFREMVASVAQRVREAAEQAAEDAARSTVSSLPEEGYVLIHSYSSTVRRTLELGVKGDRKLMVFVTESAPGMEGKQLAKDLIAKEVPVKLIADSAVDSVISDVDMVLVGADSVLANGYLINKILTKRIALLADQEEIPFCVTCESAKFSTSNFLGEPVQFAETLFDITSSEHVTRIITELGSVVPGEVQHLIRKMLSQLYP